jgi:hypothetical protein
MTFKIPGFAITHKDRMIRGLGTGFQQVKPAIRVSGGIGDNPAECPVIQGLAA